MAKYFWLLFLLFFKQIAQGDENLILSLENAKEIALKNNPEYQIQLKRIDLQKGWYWSELMPESPELGMEVEEVPLNLPYSSYGERKLFISQGFDFPTNYLFRHMMNRAKIQQEMTTFKQFKRELFFQVEQAYWSLVLQNELLSLAKKNLELSQNFFDKSKRSYELGEIDRLTMLKAKVNLGATNQKMIAVQMDLAASLAHLRQVLGLNTMKISTIDSLSDKIDFIATEKLKSGLISHPALQSAQLAKQAMANARRLAYSSFLPQISLTYFKQKINRDDFWGGEVSLSLPLWFMKQKGIIQQATAKRRIADYFYTAEQLRLNRELDQAIAHYKKAANEMRLYQTDLLQEAEEVFHIAQQSYAVGEIGYLDFIDAQQTLIQTQQDYLQSQYNFKIEKANLIRLTGIEF